MKHVLCPSWRIVISLCCVLGMMLSFNSIQKDILPIREYPLVGKWHTWVPEPWADSTYFCVEITPIGDSCLIKFEATALGGDRVHSTPECTAYNTTFALTALKGKTFLPFDGQFPYGGRGNIVIWSINDSTLGWKTDETTLTPKPQVDNFIPSRAVLKRMNY